MDGAKATGGNSRLLMLCIDSMSLPFALEHIAQLPTLRALIDKGVMVQPETPATDFSASVWPTFAFGMEPGEHGEYFPFQWNAEHHVFKRLSKPIWHRAFELEPFWYDIARAGIKATVLDAGSILNDRAAPCRQITNWSNQSTGDAASSDPALLAEVRRRFGHRPIGKEVPVPKKRSECRRIRDSLISALKRKTDAILWLMEKDQWQFFLAGFYEVHRAGHNLWPTDGAFASEAEPDALLEVYEEQDRQLKRIVERTDSETTLVVFALHGMAPNAAQEHFLQKVMARLNARYLAEHGHGAVPASGTNFISLLRKTVPYGLQYQLASILGEDVQDWVVNRTVVGGLDWSRTPAFRLASAGEGTIRLNIKGREANGFFEPDSEELARYVGWLEHCLMSIRVAGTDEPLIKRILHPHELYPGPKAHYLPDLLLQWAPAAPVERIYSNEIGEIAEQLTTGRGGNHVDGSFVLVSGPDADPETVGKIARIQDIGRFAQSCFGLPARAKSLAQ